MRWYVFRKNWWLFTPIVFLTFIFILPSCSLNSEISSNNSELNKITLSLDSTSINVSENSTLSLVIVFDKPTLDNSVIQWSIQGGQDDFQVTKKQEVIKKNSSSHIVSIEPINDNIYETPKNFQLQILGDENFKNSLQINLILMDDDSPLTDPTVSLTDLITNSTTFTNQNVIGVNITNEGSITHWCLSELQSERPLSVSDTCQGGGGPVQGWFAAKPTTFNLSSTEGLKEVYLWVANAFGNVNGGVVSSKITLDKDSPSVSTLVLSDQISSSTIQTYDSTVDVLISNDDDSVKWCLIEQDQILPAPDSPTWDDACFLSSKPTSFLLSSTGNRSVYIFTQDEAANISPSSSASINYTLNQSPIALDDGPIVVPKDSSANSINIIANDSDPESETFLIVSKTNGANGATVTITGGGTGITYQPAAGFDGIDSFTYSIEDPRGASSIATVTIHVMTTHTWTGLGIDNNWTNTNNWCGSIASGACQGGSPPNNTQVAIFNGTCINCDANINGVIDVAGIEMQNTYSGIITQGVGVGMTIGVQDFKVNGGSFIGSNSDINVNGNITFNGGTFNAPSANINLLRDFTYSSGTVDMGTSTLQVIGQSSNHTTLSTLGIFPLYNLTLSKAYDGGPRVSIADTIHVSNDLYVNFGYAGSQFNGGTIEVAGNVTINNCVGSPTARIKMVGANNQTYTQTGVVGMVGNLEFASTGGIITLAGDIQVRGEVKYTSGVIDAGTSNLILSGTSMNSNVDIGSVELYNLTVAKGYDGYPDVYITGVVNVNNNLSISMSGEGDYIYNGQFNVKGNVSVSGIGLGGSTVQLNLSGVGDQTITHSSGGFPGGTLSINKPSGTVFLNSNLNLNATSQDLILQSGILDMQGYSLNILDQLSLESGTVINQNTGLLTYGNIVNNGGTINP